MIYNNWLLTAVPFSPQLRRLPYPTECTHLSGALPTKVNDSTYYALLNWIFFKWKTLAAWKLHCISKGLLLQNALQPINRAFSKFHLCNYCNYRYNLFDWFWLRSYFKMLIFNISRKHYCEIKSDWKCLISSPLFDSTISRTLLWVQIWLKMVN